MNIPYDEMPEKIEELMVEVERLESENKHLLDLQKSMDQQYEKLETYTMTQDEEIKWLRQCVRDLQQENQQLKDKLKLVESLVCFNMPNNIPMVCMFKADYERNKYEYETLDKYKSVLDEIREYIESNKREASSHFNGKEYVFINYWLECDPNDLLQILDKVNND